VNVILNGNELRLARGGKIVVIMIPPSALEFRRELFTALELLQVEEGERAIESLCATKLSRKGEMTVEVFFVGDPPILRHLYLQRLLGSERIFMPFLLP
jgi:hypothetical protein